jgi:lipoprotein-anchoring transpeptidase ErfK/SrfK
MRETPSREPHRSAGAGGRRRFSRATFLALFSLCIAVAGMSACKPWPIGKLAGSSDGPSLELAPAANATGVPVTASVTVMTSSAVLDTVTVADPQGKQVPGEFDARKRTWRSTLLLDYDTTYTTTATGTTAKGKHHVTGSSQFSTVKPAKLTTPRLLANRGLNLADRTTYGVGQPIVVDFGERVTDKATAQSTLVVTTDPPVEGAWNWINDHEAHWRPAQYWKPGTKVAVKSNTYGRDLGDGLYSKADTTASFSIGPSKIAIADDRTFRIQVLVDGKEVRTVPTAMGLHQSLGGVDLRTRSGPHVVLGNERVTRMTSASFGLTGPAGYDQMVEWTTHISYEGEYVHAAPWSVAQQGNSDASHGCLNVNAENAMWFFNNFGPGDVVEVRNTGIPLAQDDGLGDWTVSWDEWRQRGALTAPAGARPPN